jgi:hypothetical protein
MYIMDGSFGMAISRIHFITLLTAIVIVATAAITTMPTPPAAAQQHTVHIIKDATNSYTLSGSSSHVGSFDTTYRIAGERSAIRSAENLIITTITEDFSSSPTIGYVMATNMTTSSGATNATTATLPNPFATPQQITERITSELRRVIAEGESGTTEGQNVEIKCDFRMSLEDMRCHYIPFLEAAPGDLAATTPTNTTDTGTAGG